ncbi:Pentatricopeptide repeat-containing protein mitochondrial [Zea mays]|uniref:Pentatricopeptide repeat-containing protein mitochondrial n=2 Tax=Zea mays TaxID=4577 RepID=A0A1D6GEM9_MAIZE
MRLLNDGFSTNIIMPECQVAEPALNQKEEVMIEYRPPAPAVHSRPAPQWICPVSFIELSKTTFPSPLVYACIQNLSSLR